MIAKSDHFCTFDRESALIKRQTVENYKSDNPNCRIYFDEFLEKLKIADWDKPEDMTFTFPSADLLGKGVSRVVFNVGGNHFRVICGYAFKKEVHLFIKWIGTHSEYDKLCGYAKRKKKRPQDANQYNVNLY